MILNIDELRLKLNDLHDDKPELIFVGDMKKILDRLQAAESKISHAMGVGEGGGNLFVYGDYESIKAAQTIVTEREESMRAIKLSGKVNIRLMTELDATLTENIALQSKLDELEKRYGAARSCYVDLTNNVSFADNGEAAYVADQSLMSKFDSVFDFEFYAKPIPAQQPKTTDHGVSSEVVAAYAHVDSVVPKADSHHGTAPMWHGWAIREAFIAGAKWREDSSIIIK